MALSEYLKGEVVQDFADGFLTRREALRRLGLYGLSLAGASTLLAACGGDNDTATSEATTTTAAGATATSAAGPTSTSPAGQKAQLIKFPGPAGELQGAYAAAAQPRATLLVIHENRGLTPHFYDLVGRFSNEGYAALCVDLLSSKGGTGSLTDPAAAGAALSSTPTPQLLADLGAGIAELNKRVPNKKTGTVGFCFGGGMVWNMLNAKEQRLSAAVPFYGPSPDPADFTGIKAATLGIYGALDARVNASKDRAEAALKAAAVPYEIKVYEGANHAFFNDTGERYNAKAAAEANTAMLDWFKKHL